MSECVGVREHIMHAAPVQQAALEIWIMILRFMGDLPEPRAPAATPEVKEHGSLAKRLKGSIGRKFGSSNRLSELAAEVRAPAE